MRASDTPTFGRARSSRRASGARLSSFRYPFIRTVCLAQLEMAALFDTSKQNIRLHIKNILAER